MKRIINLSTILSNLIFKQAVMESIKSYKTNLLNKSIIKLNNKTLNYLKKYYLKFL